MRRLLPLLTAAAMVSAGAQPSPAKAPAAASAINIPHEVMTLPNGLTVILAPDHSVPRVAVDVWYHVGKSEEHTSELQSH